MVAIQMPGSQGNSLPLSLARALSLTLFKCCAFIFSCFEQFFPLHFPLYLFKLETSPGVLGACECTQSFTHPQTEDGDGGGGGGVVVNLAT